MTICGEEKKLLFKYTCKSKGFEITIIKIFQMRFEISIYQSLGKKGSLYPKIFKIRKFQRFKKIRETEILQSKRK